MPTPLGTSPLSFSLSCSTCLSPDFTLNLMVIPATLHAKYKVGLDLIYSRTYVYSTCMCPPLNIFSELLRPLDYVTITMIVYKCTHMIIIHVHVCATVCVHFSPVDATLLSLYHYLCGMKQLVQFISALQSISVTKTTPHFTADKLSQVECVNLTTKSLNLHTKKDQLSTVSF